MLSVLYGDLPLVGRGTLLAEITAVVHREDALGALVYGEIGTGKSALARHLFEHCRDGVAPFLVTCAPALGSTPYGALAPFLAGASGADMASPLSVLRAVLAFFRAEATAGREVLVIVDDAHLLDDASSHLLAQLVTSRKVTVVAFARPLAPSSDELVSLSRDGLLERFDVGPLGYEESLELCMLVLGGGVVRGASDRLRDEASGNPLFLKAMLEEARAKGRLTRIDGVWTLASGALPVPAALTDLVRSVVLELSEDERTVLDLLSLGEVVSFADLVRAGGERAVSELLTRSLIRADPRAVAFAVHVHPLFGRVIRAQVPVGRSMMLRSLVGEAGGASRPLPARARIRGALWGLECGETVADGTLLELAGLALTLLDGDAALRLAAAVRSEELLAAARLHRAVGLLETGELGEAGDAAQGLLESAGTADLAGMAGMLELRLVLASGGDMAATDSIAERWATSLDRLEESAHGRTEGPSESSDGHHLQRVVQAIGHNLGGHYGDGIVTARSVLAEGSADPRVRVLAHSALAEALSAMGRSAEGTNHGLLALGVIEDHRETTADLHRLAFFRHLSLLIHSGDFPLAEQTLENYGPSEGRDYAFVGGSLAVLAGALDVRRGRFRTGLDRLRPALVALRTFDPDGLLPYALGTAGWAAAALGDPDLSAYYSQELARVQHRGVRQYALLARAFDAAGRTLLGTGRSGETLLVLAEEARDLGWLSCEKDILELATALGAERSAALLADATRSMDGAEAAVLHQYATALVIQDAAALAAAGERAELFQKYLLAADACARAMEAYARAGDSKAQRALAPVVRRFRGMIDGGVITEPSELGGVTPLTTREREIALLAVQGLTNRDIARTLTVSTRTVEGHLYRIYVKLGISRREELTREVEPLLRAT